MRDVPRIAKRALMLAGCSVLVLCQAAAAGTVQAPKPFLFPGSLIVSSSTYDNSQGAVASLTAGQTQLAGSANAPPYTSPPTCTTATAGNDYVNVWNNDTIDGSFGVTSPITLTDLNPKSGAVLATLAVPADQVVTSFSSKSELGLHVVNGANGPLLSFVGYGGAGVGAIDVSNSDAVAGQDPTNPVSYCFGGSQSTYAFPRTIVSVGKNGLFSYTPQISYGGNNGRSALYSPEAGLYYSVGNANNGSANAFGYNCPGTSTATNCSNPDVTETTGLEAINPLNWHSWNYGTIPPNNSAEADPLLQFDFNGKLDKPGKDDNFRGVAEYGGALYFTKGSGSNGVQTVYTVSPGLPTLADAASATISIVPGFPTDSAKQTGGNYTPFAVFFANPTTMYVTDEGSGNSTDTGSHAGLEKWSLVNGTWQLDYVLTNNLIGTNYTLTGYDGQYPTVTTVGLRNLSGAVGVNTVTLWATTSTSSTSGDPGADPNEVVTITDDLAATTLPPNESFSVLGAPTYGTVYRGVAYVTPTWHVKGRG
jgi:hypothetical protein